MPKGKDENGGILSGTAIACLGKISGAVGLAGFMAAFTILVALLEGEWIADEKLLFAAAALLGSLVLSCLSVALKTRNIIRFLKKGGYEESIRSDGPAMTNALNAFHLYPSRGMIRYIRRLNPSAGKLLAAAVNKNRAQKRKKRLGYLPYVAVLAAAYYLLMTVGRHSLPYADEWILCHALTLAVMAVCGFLKHPSLSFALAPPAVMTPLIYAYYLIHEDWYHLLICAAAAFAGECIGITIRKKRKR